MDPRQTFGKVGPTSFNAPKAASLVPVQTIEGASLVGQTNAKLGGTITDALETIRKTGIVNERQQLDSMGAQLSAKEAQIRADMFREEMVTGRKLTPEEQTTSYAERLDLARNELKDTYRFDFIADEADSYYTRHKEGAIANHTKQVVLPRMAELNRDGLLSEIDGHQKAAASLMASGDIDGAIASTQAAAQVLSKPNAAVVFDPAQRSAHQQKILQDGVKDILFSLDPEKRMELLQKDAKLKHAASAAGDPTLAMASPLKNVDASFIASLTKHTEVELRQEAERKRTEERRVQAEEANKFQFTQTEFMLDPKTSTGALQKRMFEVLQSGRQLAESNPGSPMLDAYGAAARQMQNEMESRQRKAEAAAEKAARNAAKAIDVGSFLASGQVVDITNKGSRDIGDAAYKQQEQAIASLPEGEKNSRRAALIGRLGYIPSPVEREITQGLTSDNPDLRKLTMSKVKVLADQAPGALLGLPTREQTIVRNVLRNGMPVDKAVKAWNDDALRSPEEKKLIEQKAELHLKDKGDFNPVKILKKEFGAPKTTVAAETHYEVAYKQSFATNGGDPEQSDKDARAAVASNFSVTKSDGNPVLREKQPVKFGLTPAQEADQAERLLKGKTLPDGTVLKGTERYSLTFAGTSKGRPVYGVEVKNKFGVPMALPGVHAFDPSEAAPVADKSMAAERGDSIKRAAAHFETPANPRNPGTPQGSW